MHFGRTTPWLTQRYPGDLARGRGPRSGPWRVQPTAVTSGAIAVSDLTLLTIVMFATAPGSPWGVCAFLVLAGALLAAQGQFRSRITLALGADVGPMLGAIAASLVVVSILGGFDHHVAGALHAGIVAAVVVVGARGVLYAGLRALRVADVLTERTLIIGSGPLAARFAGLLTEHREYGLEPIGFLDDVEGPDGIEGEVKLPGPLLGRTPHLPSVIVEHGIHRVVIAFGAARESAMVDIVRSCVDASVNVHMLPRFFELGWTPRYCQMDDVWGYPLVRLPQSAWRPAGRLAKRTLDVVVASAALLVVSPLYVALAIAVKVSSPGPVYFRQVRVGERSQPVEILKFRSMRVNDDADVTWDVGDDERVTPVGQFMRDFSLDELPQLWNVVRGDMSLVGPRPERPYFVERFRKEIHHYDRRHRMPGGLTGLAQVHGLRGARTSIEDRARLDNHYIQTWSFWRDVSILVRTPVVVIHHAWRDRTGARSKLVSMRLGGDQRRIAPRGAQRASVGEARGGPGLGIGPGPWRHTVVNARAAGTRVVERVAPARRGSRPSTSSRGGRAAPSRPPDASEPAVTDPAMVPMLVGTAGDETDSGDPGGSPSPPV